MVESNNKQSMDSITTQSEDTTDFVDQLRCYETKNRRVLTAREIQNFELAHNEYVMNHFMYHQQFNSIVEYETSFLQLKRWAETWSEESFDEDWVVRRFVVGLKEEIMNYVNLWRPDSLQRVIVLAKWQELCLVDHQNVLAKIEDPSSTVTQVCAESIHAKVISVSHSDYSSPSLSTNTAAGTICANKKGFPVADKVFDKKLEPRTTNHHNEIDGDGVTIEGVFDPGEKMMSCFTYMKKNDDMNRPSSSIVNHEYSIKYLSAMDYSGPWVSYGSSELALVTLGYMSTTIIVFPVPLLTKLSGSVIRPLPISVLAVEKLLYASKFELQVAMPSIVDSQSRATRGSSTEIASIFVLRGVHNIMGVQQFSSEEIKSQNYRTTAIHGLTYEFDECDYISSDEFTVIYDLGWFLEDIIQILWVDSYVLPNIFQIDYNHSNSYVAIVEVFIKYLDLIPHSKAVTFGDVLEHNSVTCLKGCDVYVADSRMLIGRICLIWWTKVDSVISNMGLFQVKMSSDAFQFVRDMRMIPLIVTKSKYGTPIVSIWCLVAGEIFLSHIKFQFIGFHIDLNFQDMSYLLNNFVALRKNGQTLIAWEAYMGHELGEASMCKFVPRGILRLAAIGNQRTILLMQAIAGDSTDLKFGTTRCASAMAEQLGTVGQGPLDFICTIMIFGKTRERGAAIIKARELSSALSAISAACDHIRDWVLETPVGTWVSMEVYSDGSYNVPADLIYSFQLTCANGEWKIVQGFSINEFSRKKLDLMAERFPSANDFGNKKIVDSVVSHDCFLTDCFIEHNVVGIQFWTNSNVSLKNTLMLGISHYEMAGYYIKDGYGFMVIECIPGDVLLHIIRDKIRQQDKVGLLQMGIDTPSESCFLNEEDDILTLHLEVFESKNYILVAAPSGTDDTCTNNCGHHFFPP